MNGFRNSGQFAVFLKPRLPTLRGVFNLGPGEIIVILVAGLVILGPEKLPDMIRKAGRLYGELRRMANGFQSELRDAFEEPMNEFKSTANMAKGFFDPAVAEAEAKAELEGKAETKTSDQTGAPTEAENTEPRRVAYGTPSSALPAFESVIFERPPTVDEPPAADPPLVEPVEPPSEVLAPPSVEQKPAVWAPPRVEDADRPPSGDPT